MKTRQRIACLAASCASAFALAAPDLAPLTQATAVLNNCASVANDIAAVPTPAGHAKAALAASTNQMIASPQQKLAIDPAQAQFAQRMQAGAQRLDACGKDVRPAMQRADDFLQGLAKANLTQADAAAVAPAVGDYLKAKDGMAGAIQRLTADKVRESYMMAPLSAHFLAPAASHPGEAAQGVNR